MSHLDVFLLVIMIVIACALFFAALGLVIWGYDEGGPFIGTGTLAAVAVVGAALVAFVGLPLGDWLTDDGDGLHKWKGGHGDHTECWYATQDDTVIVGKIITTEQNVYTVCR